MTDTQEMAHWNRIMIVDIQLELKLHITPQCAIPVVEAMSQVVKQCYYEDLPIFRFDLADVCPVTSTTSDACTTEPVGWLPC